MALSNYKTSTHLWIAFGAFLALMALLIGIGIYGATEVAQLRASRPPPSGSPAGFAMRCSGLASSA